MAVPYENTVQACADEAWSEWFVGLAVAHTGQGEAILRGDLVDQAALRGVVISVHGACDAQSVLTPTSVAVLLTVTTTEEI